jgi:hypothetical protein
MPEAERAPRRAPVPAEPALPAFSVLLDSDAMPPFLHRSLGPGAPFPDIRIRFLRYKPGTSLVVRYNVGLGGRSYDATAMIAAGHSLARRADKPENVALTRLVAGRTPASRPLYYESHLDALIQWFPLDLELPTLAEPPARLLDELDRVCVRLGVVDGDPSVLAYKPRRQAVLGIGDYVLKLYAEQEQFDRAAAGLRATGGLESVRAPAFEAALPAKLVTVQRRLPGSPPPRAAVAAREAGELLAEVHAAWAPVAPAEPAPEAGLTAALPSHQLAAAAAWAPVVTALLPALGGRLQALLQELEATLPSIDRLVLSHGDFNARQLLTTPDDGLAVIDWDSIRLAPAALDPATYAAHVVFGGPRDLDEATDVLEQLLEGYGDRPPGLSWYLATSIVRRTPEPFRYLDEHWPERIEGMVAASEAALRL